MKIKIGIILIIACFALNAADFAYSQEKEWNIFSTRFCDVFYEKDVNLKLVNRRINLRFSDFYNPRSYREKADLSMEEVLSDKFDAVFMKVEEILDMFPSKVHVAIHIYKTKHGLNEAYEGIFGQSNTAESFYVYKTNTIYTTERAIREGLLAHEMAHCIVDHYFVILPPRKVQEMLAVYADIHLKD
ncbi:hypothetical protein ACFL2G_01515 [Candidatus Omnitrophota bacterium]